MTLFDQYFFHRLPFAILGILGLAITVFGFYSVMYEKAGLEGGIFCWVIAAPLLLIACYKLSKKRDWDNFNNDHT